MATDKEIKALKELAESEGIKNLLNGLAATLEANKYKGFIDARRFDAQIEYSEHLQRWDLYQVGVLFGGVFIAGWVLHLNADLIAGLLGAIIGNSLPKLNLFGQKREK
jgi:hypothetical protein